MYHIQNYRIVPGFIRAKIQVSTGWRCNVLILEHHAHFFVVSCLQNEVIKLKQAAY